MYRRLPAAVLALIFCLSCDDQDPAEWNLDAAVSAPDTLPRPDQSSPPDRALPDLVPWRPDGPSTMGKACAADSQCSAGLVCDTSMPDGMCTRACAADTQCGSFFSCRDKKCVPRCNVRTPVSDCRARYVCQLQAGKSWCTPSCAATGVCASGLTCDKKSGLCLNPKGGTLGAACGVSIGDCSGTPNGVCLAVISMTKPYCTVPCSPFAGDCPTEVPGAYCTAGSLTGEYCVFYCDTKKSITCPHTKMQCKALGSYELCIPQ